MTWFKCPLHCTLPLIKSLITLCILGHVWRWGTFHKWMMNYENLTRNHLPCLAPKFSSTGGCFLLLVPPFLSEKQWILALQMRQKHYWCWSCADSAALYGCHKRRECFAIFGSRAWRHSCITYLRPSLMSPLWNKWMALVCEKLALCRFV